ncbi:hypothetical protein J6590_066668 [Homalodisca vitripennis]|nr:hypothetical protein J6590_066668 [Homalodisca vitripennis]
MMKPTTREICVCKPGASLLIFRQSSSRWSIFSDCPEQMDVAIWNEQLISRRLSSLSTVMVATLPQRHRISAPHPVNQRTWFVISYVWKSILDTRECIRSIYLVFSDGILRRKGCTFTSIGREILWSSCCGGFVEKPHVPPHKTYSEALKSTPMSSATVPSLSEYFFKDPTFKRRDGVTTVVGQILKNTLNAIRLLDQILNWQPAN